MAARRRSSRPIRGRSTAGSTSAPRRSRRPNRPGSRTTASTSSTPTSRSASPTSPTTPAPPSGPSPAHGGTAILAGGTGLYLRAIARGLDTSALPSDPTIRARLEADLAAEGVAALAARLARQAPYLAANIDLNNGRRVVRALEIAEIRGDGPLPPTRGYGGPLAWIGLTLDPAEHRRRIAARAQAQFDAGLIEEAAALRERFDPSLPAFSAIGYAEAWAVLDGELTREAAIERDAARNVAFARRQGTWFRSEPDIAWHDTTTASPLAEVLEVTRRLG